MDGELAGTPFRPLRLHRIYRLRLERDCDRVRLITRGGYNWTDRYPWIVEAALKNRYRQFVIDGEAVVLGVDGIADFNALHSRKHDEEVQLYAFDILALDRDEDVRGNDGVVRRATAADRAALRSKIEALKPSFLAFTSKNAGKQFLGGTVSLGEQLPIGGTKVFV